MSENTPEIRMVEVPRHDVTVTMNDLLEPLTTTAARLRAANVGRANQPEVTQRLERFTELITALRDVTRDLEQADSQLLESKRGPAPDL